MAEHSPLVLRHMLALRRFPILDAVDLREVAVVAENVRVATYRAGATVVEAGAPVAALQLVLGGMLRGDVSGRTWGPDRAFGLVELLATHEVGEAIVATTDTQVLQLLPFQIEDILEDNFGILTVTLGRFARRLARFGRASERVELPTESGALGLVERLVILRQLLPFAHARLRALAMVAHGVRERSWSAGDRIVEEGARADQLHVILEGTCRVLRGGHPLRTLAPSDTIAIVETLARSTHEVSVEATTAARTLSCSTSMMYDVFEDHSELGIAVLRTCARALLR